MNRLIVTVAWILWAAAVFGIVVLAVTAGKAHAESFSMRDENNTAVTITDEPCDQAREWLNMARATMRFKGRDYAACWATVGTIVLIFDDDGDVTPIQMQRFEPDVRL